VQTWGSREGVCIQIFRGLTFLNGGLIPVFSRYNHQDKSDKMGRELQKKKNRSSTSKVTQKAKSKRKLLHNPIIAANW
jgi:hypothetical protein